MADIVTLDRRIGNRILGGDQTSLRFVAEVMTLFHAKSQNRSESDQNTVKALAVFFLYLIYRKT
jgi:hypothetical protein